MFICIYIYMFSNVYTILIYLILWFCSWPRCETPTAFHPRLCGCLGQALFELRKGEVQSLAKPETFQLQQTSGRWENTLTKHWTTMKNHEKPNKLRGRTNINNKRIVKFWGRTWSKLYQWDSMGMEDDKNRKLSGWRRYTLLNPENPWLAPALGWKRWDSLTQQLS